MKNICLILILAFVVAASSSKAFGQATVRSFNITFATTGDDKDWNTQLRVRLVVNGQDVASLFCCDQDHNIDNWKDHTTTDRTLILNNKNVTLAQLQNATLVIGMTAKGNDTWIFIPTLRAKFNDGNPPVEWTWGETSLVSNNTEASKTFPIPPKIAE